MLSILNILKKYQSDKANRRAAGQGGARAASDPLAFPAAEPESPVPGRQGPTSLESCLSICAVVNKDVENERYARIKQWYQETLAVVKSWYQPSFAFDGRISQVTGQALSVLQANYKEAIGLCTAEYEHASDWLYGHVLNVTLLSLEIGKGMRFDAGKLGELGAAALIHDIGELACLDLVNKQSRFSLEEYKKIKDHPRQAEAMLKDSAIAPAVLQAVVQEHERLDGSGYPAGLRVKAIGEFAQIIAVADVYEAMTHGRPYRRRCSSPEAIEELLRNKRSFSQEVLKVLLERIGIYPVGTPVRLNTKEAGVVSKVNYHRPLRPVITVMFDKNGLAIPNCKELDLAANPLVSIEACLDTLPLSTGA